MRQLDAGPTIAASAARWLREALVDLGLPADQVFADAQLRPEVFALVERVDRLAYLEAKAIAARRLGDLQLGLRLGTMTRLEDLELFGAVVSHASTVREAIALGLEAVELWEEGTETRCELREGTVRLHYRNLYGGTLARRVDNDQSVVFLALAVQRLLRSSAPPLRLFVPGPPVRDARVRAALEAVGTVRSHADAWYVELPHETLDLPLAPTHPTAKRLLTESMQRALDARRHRDDLQTRLRALLRKTIETPLPVSVAARALGLSVRSLQQQLEARGTSYSGERDAVRIEVARELLGDSTFTVSQVAARVGFSSVPGFSRFFRKRTGVAASTRRGAR